MTLSTAVLRSEAGIREKKLNRLRSLENHIASLTADLATKASLEADVTEFDAALDALTQGEKDTLNASALVIAIRATYTTNISNSDTRITGTRSALSGVNDLVQADGDYGAGEKTEFSDAKTNEV